jgi:hypothetical protein
VGGGSRGWGRALIKAGSEELGRDTGEWAQRVFLISLLPTPAALCDFLETSPARKYATVVAKFPPRTHLAVSWGFMFPTCTVRGLRNMEIEGYKYVMILDQRFLPCILYHCLPLLLF